MASEQRNNMYSIYVSLSEDSDLRVGREGDDGPRHRIPAK